MTSVTAVLLILTASGRKLTRLEGAVLVVLFFGYVAINYLGKPILAAPA